MAKEDPRRIPQVSGNTDGLVTVQGVNDVIRQVVEMVYQLEGRRGPIKLRDDISLEAPERYTPLTMRGNNTPSIALALGGVNNDNLALCRGAVKNDLGSWIATDTVAVVAELPDDGTISIYSNSGLTAGQIFNPTLIGTISPAFTGAKVYTNAALTFPQGGATDSYFIPYGAVEIDTDGFFSSGSPTRLTVPSGKGGKYLVGGNVACTTSGAMTYVAVGIKRSGTTYISYTTPAAAPIIPVIASLPPVLVSLTEGAYLEVGIKTDGSGTATLNSGVAYCLWMYRVST